MRKTIGLLLLSVLVAAVSSCSDDTQNPGASNDQIVPLAVGNYWEYWRTEYDVASGTSVVTDTATVVVSSSFLTKTNSGSIRTVFSIDYSDKLDNWTPEESMQNPEYSCWFFPPESEFVQ